MFIRLRNLLSLFFFLCCILNSTSGLASPSPGEKDPPPILDQFPRDFRWCVASSAHQIEGYNQFSDWWAFEQKPGSIHDGSVSGPACDHWNRVEEDTRLLEELGVRMYRFSIEWAKIEPSQGVFDDVAIEHYRKEIALLRARGIEPLVTLHHFTLPKWVSDLGGLAWSGFPGAFETYARKIYTELGSQVVSWITFNEPQTLLGASYIDGTFPPNIKDIKAVVAPVFGLIRGHAQAYHALHAIAASRGASVRIGMAHHLRIFEPAHSWNMLDLILTGIINNFANWSLLDALDFGHIRINIPLLLNIDEKLTEAAGTQDFLGLNYYSRDLITFDPKSPGFIAREIKAGAPKTDLGWEIYPEGMYLLLKELHRRFPDLEIEITENGLADQNDTQRIEFMRSHLQGVLRAMNEGVPVKSYCHWTLYDNFEWAEGFKPRFGLYENDHLTQSRQMRPSAHWYSELIHTGLVK